MFLDSFRVLTERFADGESWMTPLEALGALHISKIGLYTEAPGVYGTVLQYQLRRLSECASRFC